MLAHTRSDGLLLKLLLEARVWMNTHPCNDAIDWSSNVLWVVLRYCVCSRH